MDSKSEFESAIDNVVMYYMDEEAKHFSEYSCSEASYKDKESFVELLKGHTFYELIVLECRGNEKAIQARIDEEWDNVRTHESDDEDEDEEREAEEREAEEREAMQKEDKKPDQVKRWFKWVFFLGRFRPWRL